MTSGRQGFASMDKARRKQIASQGGKAAHANGKAHVWTSEEASEAVKKTRHYKKKNEN